MVVSCIHLTLVQLYDYIPHTVSPFRICMHALSSTTDEGVTHRRSAPVAITHMATARRGGGRHRLGISPYPRGTTLSPPRPREGQNVRKHGAIYTRATTPRCPGSIPCMSATDGRSTPTGSRRSPKYSTAEPATTGPYARSPGPGQRRWRPIAR